MVVGSVGVTDVRPADGRVPFAKVHGRPLAQDRPGRVARDGRSVEVRQVGHGRLVAKRRRGGVEVGRRRGSVLDDA